MGDPFRQVRPGEALRIPAEAWNRLMRMAEDAGRRGAMGAGGMIRRHRSGLVRVRNSSGAPRPRFDVLGINAPVTDPLTSLDEFKRAVVVDGVTPTTAHRGKFCILQESLPEDAIGWAAVSGPSICRILGGDFPSFSRVDVADGVTSVLAPFGPGSAQPLWIQPVFLGNAWAIVRLGNPPILGTTFAVLCTISGGANGDENNTVSWVYTVTTLAGTVIGSSMSPEQARLPNTVYRVTPTDSPGLAYYDQDGDLHLWSANEQFDPEQCEDSDG